MFGMGNMEAWKHPLHQYDGRHLIIKRITNSTILSISIKKLSSFYVNEAIKFSVYNVCISLFWKVDLPNFFLLKAL